MSRNDTLLKVKIAITILLIATIDLLGAFVALSDVDADQVVGVSSRLWLMLGPCCALAITATVLIAAVRLTSGWRETWPT